MHDLRELLDADRDNLLDVVDWLAAMPHDNFERHVNMDLNDTLDPVARQALRHTLNLERWRDCLEVLFTDLQRQFTDPARKTPEFADWRQRALAFQTLVLRRRAEADELIRQWRKVKGDASARAATKAAQRDAGDRAIQRLIEAHRQEFVGYLAQEYAADGMRLGDGHYRQLRNVVAAQQDGLREVLDA